MPRTEVVFFANKSGSAPVLDWLDSLLPKVQDKCVAFVELLTEKGHELRRPHADYLRDGIYELRIGSRGVNYRILYFFHADLVVLSHGMTKEKSIPSLEIERAIANMRLYKADKDKHTFRG